MGMSRRNPGHMCDKGVSDSPPVSLHAVLLDCFVESVWVAEGSCKSRRPGQQGDLQSLPREASKSQGHSHSASYRPPIKAISKPMRPFFRLAWVCYFVRSNALPSWHSHREPGWLLHPRLIHTHLVCSFVWYALRLSPAEGEARELCASVPGTHYTRSSPSSPASELRGRRATTFSLPRQ